MKIMQRLLERMNIHPRQPTITPPQHLRVDPELAALRRRQEVARLRIEALRAESRIGFREDDNVDDTSH